MKIFEDFITNVTEINVVMLFRRYDCKFLFFRKWVYIPFEVSIYVYEGHIRYIEQGIDKNNLLKISRYLD